MQHDEDPLPEINADLSFSSHSFFFFISYNFLYNFFASYSSAVKFHYYKVGYDAVAHMVLCPIS